MNTCKSQDDTETYVTIAGRNVLKIHCSKCKTALEKHYVVVVTMHYVVVVTMHYVVAVTMHYVVVVTTAYNCIEQGKLLNDTTSCVAGLTKILFLN